MDKQELPPIGEISERIVAIVRFGPGGFPTDGFRAGEYFQVTIDPEHISPSGEFIRFGNYQGDEIVGWQRCKAITLVEVLGTWERGQNTPTLRYGDAGIVPMMSLTKTVEVQ